MEFPYIPDDVVFGEICKYCNFSLLSKLSLCNKKYDQNFKKIIKKYHFDQICKEYLPLYNQYLETSGKIGIINVYVKYLYSSQRLNNYLYNLDKPHYKNYNDYLNIPRVELIKINGIDCIIHRNNKQLVKSIYKYFGFNLHKVYYSIIEDDEMKNKIINLFRSRNKYKYI